MNQNLVGGYDVSNIMAEAVATGLFISLCTVQAPDGNVGASGAPSGVYANVAGLVDIPCMDAPQPPSENRIGSETMRAGSQLTSQADRHVLLNSYYPTLLTGWRTGDRAIVDGITYELCGVETDSQRQMLRLELKLITAGAVQP